MRKLQMSAALIAVASGAWLLFGSTLARENALSAQAPATLQEPQTKLDVPFVPTPREIVDKMLELAQVKEGDLLYDLGCGDGRIVVTAAKTYGVKAVGIDIDPDRIKDSNENVKDAGVEELVTIKQANIFEEDLSQADVVTMYLLPSVNERLKPQLRKLKPGSRIVSHSFSMEGVKPEKVVEVETSDGIIRDIYLWTIPWQEED